MKMNKSDEDRIKDIERQIAEGRELEGAERVRVRASRSLSVSFAIRLSPQEYQQFDAAAKARGMKLADFLRSSARAAISSEVDVDKAAVLGEARVKARELAEALNRL